MSVCVDLVSVCDRVEIYIQYLLSVLFMLHVQRYQVLCSPWSLGREWKCYMYMYITATDIQPALTKPNKHGRIPRLAVCVKSITRGTDMCGWVGGYIQYIQLTVQVRPITRVGVA